MDLSCLEGFLCGADLAGIRAWTFNLTVEEESELTDSGKLEHHQLGQRFRARLAILQNFFLSLTRKRYKLECFVN